MRKRNSSLTKILLVLLLSLMVVPAFPGARRSPEQCKGDCETKYAACRPACAENLLICRAVCQRRNPVPGCFDACEAVFDACAATCDAQVYECRRAARNRRRAPPSRIFKRIPSGFGEDPIRVTR